jgi:hypothetical protein
MKAGMVERRGVRGHFLAMKPLPLAALAIHVVGVPGVGVLFPFPSGSSAEGVDEFLFFLPDEGSVLVFGKPLRLSWSYDPSAKDREGDSPFCGVVESGPKFGVVTVSVPEKGRVAACWLTFHAASNSWAASASDRVSHNA